MAEVTWDLRLYDIDGNPLTGASYDPANGTTNRIWHAENRTWTVNLNTYDQLDFQVYLDDPMAALIRRGSTVVKLYRTISDTVNDKYLTLDENEDPCFGGVVTYTLKSGADNTMQVTCMSALWRLQSHFHILNHYLETNPFTEDIYTVSEMMWELINLVNGAFGGDSRTGIIEGDFLWGLPDEPQIGPYFVGKGTNTWSNILNDMLSLPAAPDILPQYIHEDGFLKQMKFTTVQKRGSDVSTGLSFNFHTTSDSNCDDMSEEEQLVPGDFGNYQWVTGYGGPNAGMYAARENASGATGSDGTGEIGVYMRQTDYSDVKRVSGLSPLVEQEFTATKHPIPTYVVTPSPVAGLYYDIDFTLGDVARLNANRGALSLSNVKQRIFQAIMTMSENNVESTQLSMSKDFSGKVEVDT